MKKTLVPASLAFMSALVIIGVNAATAPTKVQNAIASQEQADKSAAASQKKIDSIATGTQDMLAQYLSVTQETEDDRNSDDQLAQIVQAQTDQMNSLSTQMGQVGDVQKGLLPLMLQMADSLAQFVKLDIPYRQDERLARVQALRAQISNPSAPIADSFQKLMQAYKDEIAAGKTVESYRGELSDGGKTLNVNFLRAGHVLLVYQTTDRSQTGYWDKQGRKWVTANDMKDQVAEAIAIADKQAPPDLMELPVEAPEVSK